MQPSRSQTRCLAPVLASPFLLASAVGSQLLGPSAARAQQDAIAISEAAVPAPRMVSGLVPLALPMYSPETRWALGAALVYYRRPTWDPLPTTSVKLGLVGTQKHQFSVSTVADQYLANRTVRLTFTGSARRFPDYFWNLGPNSSESTRESYRRDELTADGGLLLCYRPGLCGGPSMRGELYRIADTEPGRTLDSGGVAGAAGTRAYTAGVHLEWDTRDSLYFPHRGGLTVARAGVGQAFSEGRGSGALGRLDLDTRRFFQLHGEHVLAVQGLVQLRAGAAPFELLPMLGGDSLLRGYYQGRYRDQHLLAVQAEYRFPLAWRFGGVLFGAAGEVGPSLRALASGPMHAAGGGGLRVMLDRDQSINLRVDIAVNERGETSGYLSICEAL